MVEKRNVEFMSSDKRTTIKGFVWEDKSVEPKAVLQIAHGMVEYIDRYEEFAMFMAENGFVVAGNDHLGHGASVINKKEWGYFSELEEHPMMLLVEDLNTLRGMISAEYPDLPYIMLGHSMGSYVLRGYLTKYSEGLSGAIIVGTGKEEDGMMKLGMGICKAMAKLFGWHYRSKFVQGLSYGKAYKGFNTDGTDLTKSWLSHNIPNMEKYYADERCTFIFTLNGYYGLMDMVSYDNQRENNDKVNKELPLFIISGANDPVGNLGAGVKAVYDDYEAIGMKDITWKLYEGDGHEILNELDREVVFKDILSWINIRLAE